MKVIKAVFVSVLISLLSAIILFLGSTLISNVFASEFKLIELNEATIDYKNYEMINPNARNLLLYPEKPKESLNVLINIDFVKYIFWNNTIESLTTSSQYRSIGLETRLGLRILPQIDVMVYHHSQHLLERSHSFLTGFPEEDAVELKIYLFKKNKEESLIRW